MTLDRKSLRLLEEAMARLDEGFAAMPAFDAGDGVDVERMRAVLREVAERMHDNFPYPHPLYAGQMLKPPHAIARLAYALAQAINPNNHALDGGRASSAMEKECVAALAAMVGWETHLGHLTGGGWRAACGRARRWSPPSRRTTRTRACATSSGSNSPRCRWTRAGAWTPRRSSRGSSAGAWARWW